MVDILQRIELWQLRKSKSDLTEEKIAVEEKAQKLEKDYLKKEIMEEFEVDCAKNRIKNEARKGMLAKAKREGLMSYIG